MKLRNYITSLFFLLAPSLSFQQNTMGVFLQNQKSVNIDSKKCRAGYLNNQFYMSCDGAEVKDYNLQNEIKFCYKVAFEIENLNSNKLLTQISNLERAIDRSILYETGKNIYRSLNSFDSEMPWWSGTVNSMTEMYVDPKFYARSYIGKVGREAIAHQKIAIDLVRMAEQKSVLSSHQYRTLYEELMIGYPIIEPLTQFAKDVNGTSNPAFKINEKDLEEFKKLRFSSNSSSPELKAIQEKIVNRIKRSPEFIRYDSERERRLDQWRRL